MIRTRPGRGPAPERHRGRLERLDRVGEVGLVAARQRADPGELGEQLGGGDPGAQLERRERRRRRSRGRRRAARARGAAPSASSRALRARARSRCAGVSRLAQAREVARAGAPSRSTRLASTVVASPRRIRASTVSTAPGASAGSSRRWASSGRPRARRRPRGRARSARRRPRSLESGSGGLERDRDPRARAAPPRAAARPGRVADDDRDLVGLVARPRAGAAISTPIASASPRAPALSSSTRPSSGSTRSASGSNRSRSRWRSVALRRCSRRRTEARSAMLGPELVVSTADQLGARRQRRAVGEGDRDGDVGPAAAERVDQLELGAGEVVEAVDEHRPRAPARPGRRAARGSPPRASSPGRRGRSRSRSST